MNITSTRRADEFNRLLELDGRTDDPVAGPMLTVGQALRAVPKVEGPRPEFRTALRQRLVAVATVQGVGAAEKPLQRARTAGSSWKVQRRLTALAAGAAVVTGVTGVGLGASRSLPGQPFYGVKRAAEGAQLAGTVGTEARGKRHLEFARTRLSEVKSLSGTSAALGPVSGAHLLAAPADSAEHSKLILDTLHAMDVETRAGANDLFTAFRDSGSTEPLRALNNFSRQQYSQLSGMLTTLPANAQPSARSSLALLAVIANDTVHSASGASPTTGAGGSHATPAPTSHAKPSGRSTTPGGTKASSGSGAPSTPTKSSSKPGQLPTGAPSIPAPTQFSPPSLPTIPPLPVTSPLPTSLPTLPDNLSGLLGH
jgi:hypothetical protein